MPKKLYYLSSFNRQSNIMKCMELCQNRKSYDAYKQIKPKKGEVKRVRYIIVIQLGACYNFNIIDSGKPIFRRINLLWKQ